ncbi:MAG: peptidoglycan editing factor PgeF [Campylobacteraceae bacterium]|nr:peptidoglycan editing factor PgeF [Campylobacteraceae bacterium]
MGGCRENNKLVLDNALFTTKQGGVSKGVYESLNLGLHVGDNAKDVLQNREILRQSLGLKKLVFMEQIHSNHVEILKDENQALSPCDAVITNLKNIGLCAMVADCMPILLVSDSVVAAVHAGRAGIIQKITSKTINLMREKFNAGDIKVIVGPHIKGSCYEIGNLDLGEFNKFVKNSKFDMKEALLDELKDIPNLSVQISEICTHCDENYFSYRSEKTTGRFVGVCYLN